MARALRPAVGLGIALCLGSPATARAQAAPSAQEADARARFQQGVAALEESRFAEAAALFEESYRVNPAPVALFNLAFAYRGLGRYLDAARAIERFLENPGSTPTDRINAAAVELGRIRQAVARVTVRATPADATVLVDGRPARVGTDGIELDPGRRVIEVSRDGYRPARRELVLTAGAREALTFALAVIDDAGRLRVEPSVPGARVMIDGALAGTGVVERPARAGTHRVVITAQGYTTLERTVRVGGTGLVRVDAVLQRPRANPWPWLGPTIGVVAATGLAVGGYFLWDALRPTAEPVRPADAWGDPVY